MSTGQPRRPAGTPAGGQWAPSPHAEADIDLNPPGPRADKAGRGPTAKVLGWSGFPAKALEWRRVVDLQPGELIVAHGKASPIEKVSFHPAGTHDLAPISRGWDVHHIVMDNDDLWVGPGSLVSVYRGIGPDETALTPGVLPKTPGARSASLLGQHRSDQYEPSRHRSNQALKRRSDNAAPDSSATTPTRRRTKHERQPTP